MHFFFFWTSSHAEKTTGEYEAYRGTRASHCVPHIAPAAGYLPLVLTPRALAAAVMALERDTEAGAHLSWHHAAHRR
jgi:hypothetical protein